MGFLERRRRKQHREAINWDLMAPMMLFARELALAEAEGLGEDDRGDRANQVRDSVLASIGGIDAFIKTLVDTHFDMGASAELESAFERAIQSSGYVAARRRIFPGLRQEVDGQ